VNSVYDWQMSETRSLEFEDVIWRTRVANFKRWGLDIEALTKPPLSVDDFMLELSVKLNDAVLPVWHCDSHAWGGIVARDFSERMGPLRVINFDAHHDLGYRHGKSLPKLNENGNFSCEDWAWVGLEKGWIEDYTLVYPDWLGKVEWEGIKRPWLKRFSKQIHVMTWTDWILTSTEIEEPETAVICRSSSWTPPWLDGEFQALVDDFGYSACLDCEIGKGNSSPYDTCNPRPWDWQEVNAELEIREQHFKMLQELQEKA